MDPKTKRKDAGLHEFYFGNIITAVESFKQFPQTVKPFDENKMKKYFLKLSEELLLRIKPKG